MQVATVRHATTQFPDHVFTAPTSVPAIAQIIVDPPTAPAGVLGVQGGVPGGQQGGVPGGVLNSILEGVPRPAARPAEVVPTAPTPAAPVIRRVTVGGLVKLAILVHRVEPPYPPLAKQARVSGEVHLEGVIGTDGRMKDLRVVSGPPLLVKAAYDAVIQWIYRPTTLNGDPVEVIAPITVTFHLN
jgi:protein TonB